VADFLPITPKQNACIDCHAVTEKKSGEPTPIPASHYTDYRNAPDRVEHEVVGARRVCVSCHVPTTGAPVLVENRFRP
jgi:cytochrome c-type protein NapB